MSYSDAYDPLADELEAFAQFIRHSTTAACRFALRSPRRSPHVMTSFFPSESRKGLVVGKELLRARIARGGSGLAL
jgi:hypothetical protein